jgi:hypothetical protein
LQGPVHIIARNGKNFKGSETWRYTHFLKIDTRTQRPHSLALSAIRSDKSVPLCHSINNLSLLSLSLSGRSSAIFGRLIIMVAESEGEGEKKPMKEQVTVKVEVLEEEAGGGGGGGGRGRKNGAV